MDLETKRCPRCGLDRPLTKAYWHKNKSSNDGFAGWCKACWNKREVEYRRAGRRNFDNTPPSENLPRRGMPDVDVDLGSTYRFEIPETKTKSRVFTGKCIQICDRHVTFRNDKFGFTECFLKFDLSKYKPVEV